MPSFVKLKKLPSKKKNHHKNNQKKKKNPPTHPTKDPPRHKEKNPPPHPAPKKKPQNKKGKPPHQKEKRKKKRKTPTVAEPQKEGDGISEKQPLEGNGEVVAIEWRPKGGGVTRAGAAGCQIPRLRGKIPARKKGGSHPRQRHVGQVQGGGFIDLFFQKNHTGEREIIPTSYRNKRRTVPRKGRQGGAWLVLEEGHCGAFLVD